MRNYASSLFAVPLMALLMSTSALADAEAEKMVDDALPLMYHTCQSVVDESDGKSEYVDKVIRALVAVSLYNREVDISKFAKTDAEKSKLHDKFVEELVEECKEDKNALLAGVIDNAIADALEDERD
jgi:hypothetical protein